MLDIRCIFPDGRKENFMKPLHLLMFMQEEGYTEVKEETYYCCALMTRGTLTLAEVEQWAA